MFYVDYEVSAEPDTPQLLYRLHLRLERILIIHHPQHFGYVNNHQEADVGHQAADQHGLHYQFAYFEVPVGLVVVELALGEVLGQVFGLVLAEVGVDEEDQEPCVEKLRKENVVGHGGGLLADGVLANKSYQLYNCFFENRIENDNDEGYADAQELGIEGVLKILLANTDLEVTELVYLVFWEALTLLILAKALKCLRVVRVLVLLFVLFVYIEFSDSVLLPVLQRLVTRL